MNKISFYLNNDLISLSDVKPTDLLVDLLRSRDIDQTGTKIGCGEGGCGACTVILAQKDFKSGIITESPINSCLRPVCSLDGKAIVTIEGINQNKVNLISKRLAEFNGSQCGYCSSGMVMTMYGLLRNTKEPEPAQIEDQFSGNICRCTGYRSILNAMQSFVADKPALEQARLSAIQSSFFKRPRQFVIDARGIKWINATSVKEVLALLKKYSSKDGTQVKLVNGNTSIGIYKWYVYNPKVLINIADLSDLKKIKRERNQLIVGGGVTLDSLMNEIQSLKGKLPVIRQKGLDALYKHMQRIANHQVRNVASIAGNVMLVKNHQTKKSGEPFPSDMFTVLCTLGARVEIISPGKAKAKVFDLIEMPEINHWPDGFLISRFFIPYSAKEELIRTFKISRRNQNSHAIVNAGFRFKVNEDLTVLEATIVYGGIGQIAYKDEATEKLVIGEKWSRALLKTCLDSIEKQAASKTIPMPSTGISDGYRLELTRTLFYQYFVSVSLEIAPSLIAKEEASAGHQFERAISEGEYTYLSAPYSEPDTIKSFSIELVKTSKMLKSVSPLINVDLSKLEIKKDSRAEEEIEAYPTKLTALSQTTGSAKYTHDVHGPASTLYAYYVLSECRNGYFDFTIPQDKIVAQLMKKYPSVVDLITAKDIPVQEPTVDIFDEKKPSSYDPILAFKIVTSYGQPIAMVLAKEQLDAKQAAAMVQDYIKYRTGKQPSAVTIEEALKIPNGLGTMGGGVDWIERPISANNSAANEQKSWLVSPSPVKGQVFVEGTQRTGAQYHFYMEPQGTLAVPIENGQLEIYSSTQHLAGCQVRVAAALKIPANKVITKVTQVGGGFGGKEVRPPVIAAAAAIAAHKVNHPVRLMLDRNTDMQTIGNRHPYLGKYFLSADQSGKIERLKFDFYSNAGFSQDCSVPVMDLVLLCSDGAYMVPVFRADGTVCRTNIQTRTAFRSFGLIQCSLIQEDAIEKLAHQIGKLPEEVREINFYKDATINSYDVTPYGQALKYCRINQVWYDFKEKINFTSRQKKVQEFNKANKWKKRGISMIPIKYGISYTYRPMNQGYAYVFAYSDDGTVIVYHGGVEMGQGINTKIAQIASEILGIDLSYITVGTSSTSIVPNASSTGASTGTDLNGGAVKNACLELKKRLTTFCEAYLKNPSLFPDAGANPIPADWKEQWASNWTKIVSAAYNSRIDLGQNAFFKSPNLGALDNNKQVTKDENGEPQQIFYYFTYCVAASEVEINVLTGEHEIIQSDIVYDAGRSLNPKIDIGQIEGGFVQGIGNVTTEEIYYDDNGKLLPDGTWNYKPPETKNIPIDFNIYLLKYERSDAKTFAPMDHYGIQSSKTTGEPPLVLASSVFFAIKRAIMDYRKSEGNTEWSELESPATVERIQQACKVRLKD